LVICGIERRKNTMMKFASHGVAQRLQNHPTIFPPPAAPRRNSVCGSGCAGIAAAKDGAHPNRGIVSPRFRSCPRLRRRALSSNVFVLCIAHDLRQLGVAGVIASPWGKKAVRLAIGIGEDFSADELMKFVSHREVGILKARSADELVKWIVWASVTATISASRGKSRVDASAQRDVAVQMTLPGVLRDENVVGR
jgi:hypothetical protein